MLREKNCDDAHHHRMVTLVIKTLGKQLPVEQLHNKAQLY
jgi:hypothetical protein